MKSKPPKLATTLRDLMQAIHLISGIFALILVLVISFQEPWIGMLALSVLGGGLLVVLVPYMIIRNAKEGAPAILIIRNILILTHIVSLIIFNTLFDAFTYDLAFFSADSPLLDPAAEQSARQAGHAFSNFIHPVGLWAISAVVSFLSGAILLLKNSKTDQFYFSLSSISQESKDGPVVREVSQPFFRNEQLIIKWSVIYTVFNFTIIVGLVAGTIILLQYFKIESTINFVQWTLALILINTIVTSLIVKFTKRNIFELYQKYKKIKGLFGVIPN